MNAIMKDMLLFIIIASLRFIRSTQINNSDTATTTTSTLDFVTTTDFTVPSEELFRDFSTTTTSSGGLAFESSERQKSLMTGETAAETIINHETGKTGSIGLLLSNSTAITSTTAETTKAGSSVPSDSIASEAATANSRIEPDPSIVKVKKNRGKTTESIETGLTGLPVSIAQSTLPLRIKNSVVGTDPIFIVTSSTGLLPYTGFTDLTGLLPDSKNPATKEHVNEALQSSSSSSEPSTTLSTEETMTSSLLSNTMTNRSNFSENFSTTTQQFLFSTDIIDNNIDSNNLTGSSQVTPTIHGKTSQMETEFDNGSDPCEFVKCKNGAKCVFNDKFVWCKCSWAYSGSLCENAIPVYLILGLVGAGVIILFLFGILIYKCAKERSERIKSNVGSLDRKLNLIENFNRPESCAIYADPGKYRATNATATATASTTKFNSAAGDTAPLSQPQPQQSCTIPRPRLILESFSDAGGQVEYSNGYATFKRLPTNNSKNSTSTGPTVEQSEIVT